MLLDKDQVKENLTLDKVFEILKEFGANPEYQGDNIVCDTICHNAPGEGSKKLYYYSDSKLFKCYTECEPSTFDIFELIRKVFKIQKHKDLNFTNCVKYATKNVGFGFESRQKTKEELEIDSLLKKSEEKKYDVPKLEEYPDNLIKNMPCINIPSWNKDNIPFEQIQKFNIRWYPPEKQILIPNYDLDGRLIGIRVRETEEENIDAFGKYHPATISNITYRFSTALYLYGIYQNQEAIRKTRRVFVFEGEKSVLAAGSYLKDNSSVALLGSSVSVYQVEMLLGLGVSEIILCLDRQYHKWGDPDCIKWKNKLFDISQKYKAYTKFSIVLDDKNRLGYKDSPTDKGKDIFLELVKERKVL